MVDEEQPKRISTHLIQSMEILQMTLTELAVRVDLELSNNCCLDYKKVDRTHQHKTKADAWIAKGPDGTYRVEITPLIREFGIIDEIKQRSRQEKDSETAAFLKRLINQGHWLIESVSARKQTLAKVIQEIIRHQSRYLETGEARDLVGLKMETIAEAAGIHVTTVSRAVFGKSLETPLGAVPLSDLLSNFTRQKASESNDVRYAIAKLVEEEDKSAPLSDIQLANELTTLGFRVARRTVTKLRMVLKIPSARRRRDSGNE